MFYTPELCRRVWDQEKADSPLGKTYDDIAHWGAFWDYLAAGYAAPTGDSYALKIVQLLKQEGALFPDCQVLDIGCGPGTYTLPFLREGAAHVDCVDSSPGMRRELRQRAAVLGVEKKLEIYPWTWMEFREDKTYDLVFSSMSPAISEPKELLRMEEFTRGTCCLVTYASSPRDELRGKLWETLRGDRVHSDIFEAIYPFNLLYALDRHPNLHTFCTKTQVKTTVAQAYEENVEYFKIFGYTSQENRDTIRRVLEEEADHGMFTGERVSRVAAIWWKAGE